MNNIIMWKVALKILWFFVPDDIEGLRFTHTVTQNLLEWQCAWNRAYLNGGGGAAAELRSPDMKIIKCVTKMCLNVPAFIGESEDVNAIVLRHPSTLLYLWRVQVTIMNWMTILFSCTILFSSTILFSCTLLLYCSKFHRVRCRCPSFYLIKLVLFNFFNINSMCCEWASPFFAKQAMTSQGMLCLNGTRVPIHSLFNSDLLTWLLSSGACPRQVTLSVSAATLMLP